MTARPIVPRQQAERDVEQAVDDYAAEGDEEVAFGFIQALQDAYGFIGLYPHAGSLRYAYELDLPELRAYRVNGYPFIVFYLPRADHIDVWRVLHARRDIPTWMATDEEGAPEQ
ncbi:type II toxin-antitoxin system RelE/ParE family toxin [Gluconacetobacter azotocaptans]|uniref:Type II toxin-antitoxin system RelE/ParE family toxin n=1 Tax=Gluconacetobacter azotocaptans TaxID=142834 RepID=A0A7W4PC87_9PROT|nr:type II toxin-antitoxin system RelE/ParE family toxin [Gluconacetobacter azotocaptans]MBB2188370.1 type II toxin-antitoxin system RelE/ParE family toxin [Gluconacetobacter azotocaptans]MBM9400081.1 type II toxin-antitoxin system RelE/ParE family toxin [Gluconacetobacter azotocaptans]GBQ27657.1 plasmid stabilization system protein [Gluconacetobacter azotocaptans DSM 13594]